MPFPRIEKKRGTPPYTINHGRRPPDEWMAMTGRTNEDKKAKTAKRQTPMDKKMAKDIRFARNVGDSVKDPPRRSTAEEVHANNNAAFESAFNLFYIKDRLDEFEVDRPRGRGRPLKFSDAVIMLAINIMSLINQDFRTAAGIAAGLLANFGIPSPSYSRLFERCSMLIGDMTLAAPVTDSRILCRFHMEDPTDRVRRLAVDSTGLTLSNITVWRKTKWGVGPKYRGWLKVHALTDVDTNEIVAFVLTKDDVGDEGMLEYLLELAELGGVKFEEVYADAAYSSVDNFKLVCEKYKCRFITSFKSNTSGKNLGSKDRGDAARLWIRLPYDKWVEVTGYGRRWKIEGAFSDLKRMFSEFIRATSDDGMVREVTFMIRMFNYHKRIRANILGITGNGVVVGCS